MQNNLFVFTPSFSLHLGFDTYNPPVMCSNEQWSVENPINCELILKVHIYFYAFSFCITLATFNFLIYSLKAHSSTTEIKLRHLISG